MGACAGSKGKLGAAFFRTDNELTDRLVAAGKGPEKRTAGYPAAITKRLKDKMKEVGVADGLLKENMSELF